MEKMKIEFWHGMEESVQGASRFDERILRRKKKVQLKTLFD